MPLSKKKTSKGSDDDSDSYDLGHKVVKVVKKSGRGALKCALYGVKWWRIVLGL